MRYSSVVELCANGRLNRRAFGILQRQPQLLRERVDRRAASLPGAFGLEPQVADAAAPRRDDAADGAEVGAVGVLLVEPADDVRRDADERAQRRRRLDAVLAAVPRAAEDQRDLLEVVDEELLRLLVDVAGARVPPNTSAAKSFFSSCASGACATRPRPTPSSLISS